MGFGEEEELAADGVPVEDLEADDEPGFIPREAVEAPTEELEGVVEGVRSSSTQRYFQGQLDNVRKGFLVLALGYGAVLLFLVAKVAGWL
jgi:hypothetical protein